MTRLIDPAELHLGQSFALTERGVPYTCQGHETSPSGIVTTVLGMRDYYHHPVEIIMLRGEKVWVR